MSYIWDHRACWVDLRDLGSLPIHCHPHCLSTYSSCQTSLIFNFHFWEIGEIITTLIMKIHWDNVYKITSLIPDIGWAFNECWILFFIILLQCVCWGEKSKWKCSSLGRTRKLENVSCSYYNKWCQMLFIFLMKETGGI